MLKGHAQAQPCPAGHAVNRFVHCCFTAGADLLWTTAATRVPVPTDGTPVLLYSDDQVTKPNAALELATYFGWYVSYIMLCMVTTVAVVCWSREQQQLARGCTRA